VAGPVVEAQALARRFGPAPALAGVDLAAAPGEVLVIFGPNGAGKTTLLRILATLLGPSGGTVRLFGEDAFGPGAARLRARLGLVTHQSFLYPDLTAAENLRFYARLYGLGDDGAARAAELLAWAGLSGDARRPVRAFSRGMEQRLALARALVHDPALLLLDEPFTGLDPTAAETVEDLLAQARRDGKTVVVTTHDVDRGLRAADRVCILHRGRIAWASHGPTGPEDFARAYRHFVAGE
jgi:heme exporter protein A